MEQFKLKRYITTLLAVVATSIVLLAQQAPPASARICQFSPYVDSLGLFPNAGFQPSITVPDFFLFDTAGIQHSLYQYLGNGKPVILISGSYTCPQFRNSLATIIPQLNIIYGSAITIIVVYTLEAHPEMPWNSPYAYGPWVLGINTTAGISFAQHQTYGDRLAMMDTTLAVYPTNCTFLADDTCNTWLNTFGPAPNMGYVLSETGIVRGKFPLVWNDRVEFFRTIDTELNILSAQTHEQNAETITLVNYPSEQVILQTTFTTPVDIEIFDQAGRRVYFIAKHSAGASLSISNLNLLPGFYVISANNRSISKSYLQL